MTRRNDRCLTTSAGETVRNREQWLVTATHLEGGLSVERADGRGTVTLPSEYVTQHVRLGYAATEHGHQGDTVDVGIALISPATTHRGLYVATTRGRDENRIHVITETADLSEARDVLDSVLAHDRADIPAIAQRRHLAEAEGPQHRPEPDRLLPAWVQPWRQQLGDRRQRLVDDLADRQDRRTAARHELDELQPAIDTATRAWEPHARPIRDLQPELDSVLRPAMWRANHDARTASIGHRHSTRRHAADAAQAVERAEAAIVAIHADGAPHKAHLDLLQIRADNLEAATDLPDWLDQHDRQQVAELDQVVDAADTYMSWLDGRPTPSPRLAHAVETLSQVAQHAPSFAVDADTVDKTRWYQLLDLAPHHFEHRITQRREPELDLGR